MQKHKFVVSFFSGLTSDFTVGLIKSGGGLNPFVSHSVATAMTLDEGQAFEAHLAFLRRSYGALSKRMCDQLEATFNTSGATEPWLVHFRRPRGGFFVWVQLNKEVIPNMKDLFNRCKVKGVAFKPGRLHFVCLNASCSLILQLLCDFKGTLFASTPETWQHWIRLSFAYYSAAAIDQGVYRLAEAVKSFRM
jgi:DNA-binding transcriptional MocR family regulator